MGFCARRGCRVVRLCRCPNGRSCRSGRRLPGMSLCARSRRSVVLLYRCTDGWSCRSGRRLPGVSLCARSRRSVVLLYRSTNGRSCRSGRRLPGMGFCARSKCRVIRLSRCPDGWPGHHVCGIRVCRRSRMDRRWALIPVGDVISGFNSVRCSRRGFCRPIVLRCNWGSSSKRS